jgi:hypothetical protein
MSDVKLLNAITNDPDERANIARIATLNPDHRYNPPAVLEAVAKLKLNPNAAAPVFSLPHGGFILGVPVGSAEQGSFVRVDAGDVMRTAAGVKMTPDVFERKVADALIANRVIVKGRNPNGVEFYTVAPEYRNPETEAQKEAAARMMPMIDVGLRAAIKQMNAEKMREDDRSRVRQAEDARQEDPTSALTEWSPS